nr:MAG TPA: hypothetical protein [Crassvirales sp.]DAI34918.1 MAG TPA: hypothetical protein [Caudoviricetes sp.]
MVFISFNFSISSNVDTILVVLPKILSICLDTSSTSLVLVSSVVSY